MLKKLMLGAALTTLMAAPALAQSFNPGWGTGNVLPTYYDAQGRLHTGHPYNSGRLAHAATPRRAYAYVPGAAGTAGGPNAVYANGRYVGQDPDPNVRLELRSDYPIQ